MPRDSSGTYTLPPGTLVTSGQTIQPSQHNPAFEDVGSALTGSLPRNGSAPMTAPLKLVDGSAADPALAFNSVAGLGVYKTSTPGIGFSVGGTQVGEFTGSGLIGVPVGTPIPILDDTLPPLCIWADGRNVSRTTYAALFAKWGTKFGVGDGSTTFGVADLRATALAGRDNIGGTDAHRLDSVPGAANRLTTGGIVGEILHTLTQAELPAIAPTGTLPAINNITAVNSFSIADVAAGVEFTVATSLVNNSIPITYSGGFVGNALGSNSPHNTVQRSMLCNFVIFAGA